MADASRRSITPPLPREIEIALGLIAKEIDTRKRGGGLEPRLVSVENHATMARLIRIKKKKNVERKRKEKNLSIEKKDGEFSVRGLDFAVLRSAFPSSSSSARG